MRQDYLVLQDLSKVFGRGRAGRETVVAVDRVSLEVGEGELVTLLGPSGCGKTTTLRMIAGFELPSAGEIRIDGERMNDVPPNRRPTTLVFQNYALFPHMTVSQNIGYGLRVRRIARREIRRRLEEVMRLVGLAGLGDRSPAQLSGGQQQRVSLARSLIMEPKVLLLDEPLSNLDAKLRVATRAEIRRLQQRVGITSVYVTHDQEEAMTLSDRVVIMHQGRIQQIGTPQEIYARPVNRFVADFIGRANFLESSVTGPVSDEEVELDLLGTRVRAPAAGRRFAAGEEVLLMVRPESVELTPARPEPLSAGPGPGSDPAAGQGSRPAPMLIGTVRELTYLGSQVVYQVDLDHHLLTVEVADPLHHPSFAPGETVGIRFKEKSLHLLPRGE